MSRTSLRTALILALTLCLSCLASAGDDKKNCKKPGDPDKPVVSTVNKNNNLNLNENQNNLSQGQGQQQGQKQGQSQSSSATSSATGGAGGAGGNAQQSQTSSATATGNGDGANDTSLTQSYQAAKIPVATAYAPTSIPTVPCFKGYGAGVQAPNLGISAGGGKIDEDCSVRETARSYMLMGARKAACKVMVYSKQNKKLGANAVTMDDCMYQDNPPQVAKEEPLMQAPAAPPAVVPTVNVNPLQVQ
jgi:hypothetical protein